MLLLKHSPFFFPSDAIEDKELGKEETIKLLGEELTEEEEKLDLKEPKKEVKKEDDKEEKELEGKEKEDEEEEPKDELDEIEEELEEPDEEKLELATPERKRDILAKYPKLFKDFPNLEKAYYREQAFTEVLGTIEDAKLAVEKSNVLDKFEADLSKGNLQPALAAAKNLGEASFNKLVDDYLPNLARVDRDAYFHVVGNIVRTTIANMIEASKDGDKDLEAAAKIVNKFIFGNEKVTGPSLLSKPGQENTEEKKIDEREQKLIQRQFESTRDDLNTRVTNVIKSTIAANIDPKESMSDYVRKTATRDAQEKLEKLLEGDKRLGQLIDKLWEHSFKDSFSKASIDKIKSAYLSRAKTLLPGVIKEARNEALRGIGKRVRDDNDEEDTGKKKGTLPVGRTSSTSSGNTSGKSDREKARAIPKNISDREFLNSD